MATFFNYWNFAKFSTQVFIEHVLEIHYVGNNLTEYITQTDSGV